MHFGQTNQFREYFMSNRKLEVVTEEKDLGVWISQDLKASPLASHQCSQAYLKANKLLGVLHRMVSLPVSKCSSVWCKNLDS